MRIKKKNFLVVGGTNGLGLSIAEKLNEDDYEVIVTGRKHNLKLKEIDFLKIELENVNKKDFLEILNKSNGFNGVSFTQRYRPELEVRDYLKEVKVMVSFIATFIDALNEFNFSNQKNKKFTKILIAGSNYSSKIGYDQGWEYHTIKSAQLALVKYFSVKSKGDYSINLLSPATYIKRGAEAYWEKQSISQKWLGFPSRHLLHVDEIADAFKLFMLEGNNYISGNNIFIDGGLFNLYADQV